MMPRHQDHQFEESPEPSHAELVKHGRVGAPHSQIVLVPGDEQTTPMMEPI